MVYLIKLPPVMLAYCTGTWVLVHVPAAPHQLLANGLGKPQSKAQVFWMLLTHVGDPDEVSDS